MKTFALKTCVITVVGSILLYLWFKKKKDNENDQRKTYIETSRQTIIEIKLPRKYVTAVIGRAGVKIKEIQQDTQTQIHFKEEKDFDTPERICVIRGKSENVRLAEGIIRCIISNQPLIETYEIYIPNKTTGTLIGRAGQNIQKIQHASNAKIIVEHSNLNRDPNAKRRIIIKGTAEQIANALSLIEDKIRECDEIQEKLETNTFIKFPRGKSVVNTSSVTELHNVTKHSQSVEPIVNQDTDDLIEVYVSAMINPNKFWVQLIGPNIAKLDNLTSEITEYYDKKENQELHKLKDIIEGKIVAAKFSFDYRWYRAKIEKAFVDKKYSVFFIDFGDQEIVEEENLLELRTDFLVLPAQAIECSLANIKPRTREWTELACNKFEELTWLAQWKIISAKIKCYKKREITNPFLHEQYKNDSSILQLELFDKSGDKDINIGLELINAGFAVVDEDPAYTVDLSHPTKYDNRYFQKEKSKSPIQTSVNNFNDSADSIPEESNSWTPEEQKLLKL